MIDKLSISYSAFAKFILELNFKSDILNLFETVKLKLFFEDKTIFVKLLFFSAIFIKDDEMVLSLLFKLPSTK